MMTSASFAPCAPGLVATPSRRLRRRNCSKASNEIVAGGAPISPEVARRVVHLFRKFTPPESIEYRLTPHEIRLLKLLINGHNYKTAAAKLGQVIGPQMV